MEPAARMREEIARPAPLASTFSTTTDVDTFLGNWIVQARKGLLELSVLTALEFEERYGYEIVRDMFHGFGVAVVVLGIDAALHLG